MKRTLTFATALTALVLAGCGTARDLNIENPRYTIRDLRARPSIAIPLNQSSIDFDFILGVDNPNTVGLNLDRIDFSLFVNDRRLLDSVSNQRINIPARGYGGVRLTSRVNYNSIRNIWGEVADVIQGNRARYEVRGNAYYRTPVGELKFPVTVFTTR